MRNNQSLIDLIGWGLFVLIIYLVISALYGCGSVKSVDSDSCKHVLIKETLQCTKCGIKVVDPFTYSNK